MTEMIPDFFAPLEAWRKFDVTGGGRVLASVAHGGGWTRSDPGTAYCAGDPGSEHGACPSLECACGYYAYKTREHAESHGQGHVLARVEIWGRIAEHARGYRAERIRIKELFVLESLAPRYDIQTDSMKQYAVDVAALESRYGVTVNLLKGRTAWTSENRSALSLSNQSWSPSNYQIGSTIHLTLPQKFQTPSPNLHLHPQAFQLVSTPLPSVSVSPTSSAGVSAATSWQQLYNAYMNGMGNMIPSQWFMDAEPKTKPAPRQFFDFSDMKLGSCDDEGLA